MRFMVSVCSFGFVFVRFFTPLPGSAGTPPQGENLFSGIRPQWGENLFRAVAVLFAPTGGEGRTRRGGLPPPPLRGPPPHWGGIYSATSLYILPQWGRTCSSSLVGRGIYHIDSNTSVRNSSSSFIAFAHANVQSLAQLFSLPKTCKYTQYDVGPP